MKTLEQVDSGLGAITNRVVLVLTMLGMMVQTLAPSLATQGEVSVSVAAAATATRGEEVRVASLTDFEMAQVVGAGFWSSFWDGVKEATAWVIVAGLVYLVWDFCQNPQVSCVLDE